MQPGEVVHPPLVPAARIVIDRRFAALVASGRYEWPEVELAWRLCRPGDRVIEVGAGLGVVSAHIAQRIGPAGRLLAVEPGARRLPWLRRNLQAGPAPFDVAAVMLGYGGPPAVQLASLARRYAIAPDVLVLDAEGVERELFAQEAQRLATWRCDVLAELHPQPAGAGEADICRPLIDAGYRLVSRHEQGWREQSVVVLTIRPARPGDDFSL